ncbi:MAG: DNA-3-methyladenine glycosylase [Verrucomicrobiales bacterium]
MPLPVPSAPILSSTFFERDPLVCARELIGTLLENNGCSGRVIETEAYRENGDPASHLFTRPSAREFAGRHAPGAAYVYLNYGVHWLANVLCRDRETGEAGFVLFRALEPAEGLETMIRRRRTSLPRSLCSGPGKLAAALGIGVGHHGRSLVEDADFCLRRSTGSPSFPVATDKRIGISSGRDLPWRFLVPDHPGVSAKVGKGR